jgi:hypothetical protein
MMSKNNLFKYKFAKYHDKILTIKKKMSGGAKICCMCNKIDPNSGNKILFGTYCYNYIKTHSATDLAQKKNEHWICDVHFDELIKNVTRQPWDDDSFFCPCNNKGIACNKKLQISFEKIHYIKHEGQGYTNYGKSYLIPPNNLPNVNFDGDMSRDPNQLLYTKIMNIILNSGSRIICPNCQHTLLDNATVEDCLAVKCSRCKTMFCGLCFGTRHNLGRSSSNVHSDYIECASLLESDEKELMSLFSEVGTLDYYNQSKNLGWHSNLSRMMIREVFKGIRKLVFVDNFTKNNIETCYSLIFNHLINKNLIPHGLKIKYLSLLRTYISDDTIFIRNLPIDKYAEICKKLNLLQALDTDICLPGVVPLKSNCIDLKSKLVHLIKNGTLELDDINTNNCQLKQGDIPDGIVKLYFDEKFNNGGSIMHNNIIPQTVKILNLGGLSLNNDDYLSNLPNIYALDLGKQKLNNLPRNIRVLYLGKFDAEIDLSAFNFEHAPNLKVIYTNKSKYNLRSVPETVKFVIMDLPSLPLKYNSPLDFTDVEKMILNGEFSTATEDIDAYIYVPTILDIAKSMGISELTDDVFRNNDKILSFRNNDITQIIGNNKRDISGLFNKNRLIKNAYSDIYQKIIDFITPPSFLNGDDLDEYIYNVMIANENIYEDDKDNKYKTWIIENKNGPIIINGNLNINFENKRTEYESLKLFIKNTYNDIYDEKQRMRLMNYEFMSYDDVDDTTVIPASAAAPDDDE